MDSLKIVAEAVEGDPMSLEKLNQVHQKRDKLRKHYDEIEIDAKQTSHVNWQQLRQCNTKFFGKVKREKWWKNSLFKLTNERGEAHTTVGKITDKCIQYFSSLFSQPLVESESFTSWFPRVITPSMNIWLT